MTLKQIKAGQSFYLATSYTRHVYTATRDAQRARARGYVIVCVTERSASCPASQVARHGDDPVVLV